MQQYLTGTMQKRLESLRNEANPPWKRLKEFRTLVDEIERMKGGGQEKLKEVYVREGRTILNVCWQALKR